MIPAKRPILGNPVRHLPRVTRTGRSGADPEWDITVVSSGQWLVPGAPGSPPTPNQRGLGRRYLPRLSGAATARANIFPSARLATYSEQRNTHEVGTCRNGQFYSRQLVYSPNGIEAATYLSGRIFRRKSFLCHVGRTLGDMIPRSERLPTLILWLSLN